jgi:hypothetical protein
MVTVDVATSSAPARGTRSGKQRSMKTGSAIEDRCEPYRAWAGAGLWSGSVPSGMIRRGRS